MVLRHAVWAAVETRDMTRIAHPLNSLDAENLLSFIFRDFLYIALIPDETHIMNDIFFQVNYVHIVFLLIYCTTLNLAVLTVLFPTRSVTVISRM